MVRIVRVRQAGTGYGGTGNPKAVPFAQHGAKDQAIGDVHSPVMLRAYAAMRARAASAIRRTPIGSRGRL